jgi:hypothetical protein
MRTKIFILIMTLCTTFTVNAQSINDIKGNYLAEVDLVAMMTGFNPESFNINNASPQIQITDTFSFAEVQKLLVPKDNEGNPEIKITITDNLIVFDKIGGVKKLLEFNDKDVRILNNQYFITTKEKEEVVITNEKDYLYIDYSKNKLKIKR